MDRLFIDFHLRLLLSFMLVGFLARAFIAPRIEARVLNNIEDTLSAPLAVMAEVLSDEQSQTLGTSRLMERAQKRFAAPVVIIQRQALTLSADLLERIDRGEVVCEHGTHLRATLYVRIGKTEQVVRLGPLNPIHPFGQRRGIDLVIFGFCGLTLGVYLLVRPLRRRLAKLSQAAEAFGRGNLTARASDRTRDAIGGLAAAFNRMADEIQRLIAAQQELLRMVSHELRTPLQRMHFAVERARDAKDLGERNEGLLRIERDMKELDGLIEELLTYVRLQHDLPLKPQLVNLHELATAVIATQAELADSISLSITETPQQQNEEISAMLDRRLVKRALSNLIENALRHARSRVFVSVSRSDSLIQIDIDDDGPGVPEHERERIFQPFAQPSESRPRGPAGCGLGLAIVRRIAERHHGSIVVNGSRLGGAHFRLTLPTKFTD